MRVRRREGGGGRAAWRSPPPAVHSVRRCHRPRRRHRWLIGGNTRFEHRELKLVLSTQADEGRRRAPDVAGDAHGAWADLGTKAHLRLRRRDAQRLRLRTLRHRQSTAPAPAAPRQPAAVARAAPVSAAASAAASAATAVAE